MAEDAYMYAAQQQGSRLRADRARVLADLEAARAENDYAAMATCVQEVADIDARGRNLNELCEQYVASQQPPVAPELTQEEINAKPWSRMTPEDGLSLARQSKYGRDLNFSDPLVRAGYVEASRRRARGE